MTCSLNEHLTRHVGWTTRCFAPNTNLVKNIKTLLQPVICFPLLKKKEMYGCCSISFFFFLVYSLQKTFLVDMRFPPYQTTHYAENVFPSKQIEYKLCFITSLCHLYLRRKKFCLTYFLFLCHLYLRGKNKKVLLNLFPFSGSTQWLVISSIGSQIFALIVIIVVHIT